MIKLKDLLSERISPSMQKKIEGDLYYIVGMTRNPMGAGGSTQVHNATKGLNDSVAKLVLDLADSRGYNWSEVEKAYDESGLDAWDFYEQIHTFYDKAL